MNIFLHRSQDSRIRRYSRIYRLAIARKAGAIDELTEETRQLHEVVSANALIRERHLLGRCWFEYGYLSPMKRNELFTEAYVAAYRSLAPELGASVHDPVNTQYAANTGKEMNALMAARQLADDLGLPYLPFCLRLLKQLVHGQGHKNAPRPNQLSGAEARAIGQRFREEILDGRGVHHPFDDPLDPRLQADRYQSSPPQLGALSAMGPAIKYAVSPQKRLGRLMSDGLISEAEARARFGETLVDAALQACGPARFAVNGGTTVNPYRPSCFGLAPDPANETCQACPVYEYCGKFQERVTAAQVAVTGSATPRADRERDLARLRKRKERYSKTPTGVAGLEAARLELIHCNPKLARALPSFLPRLPTTAGKKRGRPKKNPEPDDEVSRQ